MTTNVSSQLNLLGLDVKDVVTNTRGIVTSIAFDLYGCVQALVRLPLTKEGKEGESFWLDTKRLKVMGKTPVMARPDFVEVPGPERLPIQR